VNGKKKIKCLITIGVHKGKNNVGANLISFCEWLMILVGKDTMNYNKIKNQMLYYYRST